MSDVLTEDLCPQCKDHPTTTDYRWLRHRDDGLRHRILYWRGGVWSLCGERRFGDPVVYPKEAENE